MISMVVVNYNAGSILTECIGAALPQVDEIILVDNASSDGSLEECQQAFAGVPQLQVLRSARNLGFAAACNLGYARARGDFVLFLNPDCILSNGAAGALRHALEADAAAAVGGALLVGSDGREQGCCRRALPTPGACFARAFGLLRLQGLWPSFFADFYRHREPLPDMPAEVDAVSGACMFVRREAIADVGLWDEGYFLHCEDLDWCMRFRQKGWKILFVPGARIFHAQGVCSRSRPVFVEWHKHRGMMRFYRKFLRHRYPAGMALLVGVGVWSRFVVVAAACALRSLYAGKEAIRG